MRRGRAVAGEAKTTSQIAKASLDRRIKESGRLGEDFDKDARKGPGAQPRIAMQSLPEFLRSGLRETKNVFITMR